MSITNNSKRKNRLPNNTNNRPNKPTRGRPKGMTERNVALEGVYNNARFMHAAASSVGCILHIQVGNGNVYEGVFSTFSQDLDIVLEMVNRVDKDMTKIGEYGPNSLLTSLDVQECVAEKMIFKLSDIVSTCAASIDLDYATRDGFTDTSISKPPNSLPERKLEPWEEPDEELHNANTDNLDGEEDTKGWDANEMFRTNAEKYNVKSSYDSTLTGYTIPLEPKNTDEYKKQEAKASKIAQEIENNPSYKQRISVENGDEEDRYSAVLRPVDNMSGPGSRYPPGKKPIPSGNKVLRPGGPVSPYVHPNKSQAMNTSVTATHSFSKNNTVPTPPNSLPIMNPNKPHHPVQIPNAPMQVPNTHYVQNLPPRAAPSNHSVPGPPQQQQPQLCQESNGSEAKADSEQLHNLPPMQEKPTEFSRFQDENVAPQNQDPSSNKAGDKRRDEKKGVGRDEQIAEFKRFSSDFKLSEDHKPNDPNNMNPEDCTPPPNNKDKGEEESPENERTPDSESPKLTDSVKKHVLNPNAKAFTPRAVPTATPPAVVSVPSPRMHTQSPVVAVPPPQLVSGLGQPIFTAMAPPYVMPPNPAGMSLTPPFAPGTINQAPRFRKTVPMNQQDFSPSVHVAAATGQPILTPAGIPTPGQLAAVQYNPTQGMMAGPSPHQLTYSFYRYPTMMGPRVVSPQPVGSYGEVFMSPHPGGLQVPHSVSVNAVQTMVPQGNPPGQNPQNQQSQGPCTPMHTAPSPVHQQGPPTPHGTPSQTPTPTGHPVSAPQSVVYHSGIGTMQGGMHNPGVPTSQPMQLHASHMSQGHPHHANFATQHVVLMHQQPVQTHGPHPASLGSAGPHSLQGHAIHGQASNHLGNPPHVISHATPMTVIPTSAAMVHASIAGNPFAQHHQHQHPGRDRARQHTGNR